MNESLDATLKRKAIITKESTHRTNLEDRRGREKKDYDTAVLENDKQANDTNTPDLQIPSGEEMTDEDKETAINALFMDINWDEKEPLDMVNDIMEYVSDAKFKGLKDATLQKQTAMRNSQLAESKYESELATIEELKDNELKSLSQDKNKEIIKTAKQRAYDVVVDIAKAKKVFDSADKFIADNSKTNI